MTNPGECEGGKGRRAHEEGERTHGQGTGNEDGKGRGAARDEGQDRFLSSAQGNGHIEGREPCTR
jgi:hypothetical protein